MLDKQLALEAIFVAVDELNGQLAADQKLSKTPNTALTGDGSPLDSLGLINLLVAVEQTIATTHGINLHLLDETLLGDPEGPYHTVDSLATYASSVA